MQQPDPSYLLQKTGIDYPLLGFYDVPEYVSFEPVRETRTCVFAYFKHWMKGGYIWLSRENHACPGVGKWLCSVQTRSREAYVKFLADEEGLKASRELMGLWLDEAQAIIGATDMAMRKYLPPDVLAFTVTRPMFEQLSSLGSDSYLEKRFLSDLMKARAHLHAGN